MTAFFVHVSSTFGKLSSACGHHHETMPFACPTAFNFDYHTEATILHLEERLQSESSKILLLPEVENDNDDTEPNAHNDGMALEVENSELPQVSNDVLTPTRLEETIELNVESEIELTSAMEVRM